MDERRRQLLSLSASALLLASTVPGCALFDSTTDFDIAVEALEEQLQLVAEDQAEADAFMADASAIVDQTRRMRRSHERFLSRLDRGLRDWNVDEDELLTRIRDYDAVYRQNLGELLRLQQQLREQLTADEWQQIAAALNTTAERLQIRTVGGA